VYQAGLQAVVASCGTALTPQQAQQLRRFTSRIILSFDPDTAGQGAATKSCEMLVAEGFDVNVAMLPPGGDPDTFIRRQGRQAYGELLKQSKPYLEYLLDRVAAGHDLQTDEGRVKFFGEMLPIAGRIPDVAMRDRFADRIAFKARVTDEVVRAEIRKAAVQKQPGLPRKAAPTFGQVTKAEKGLIEAADFEGLASREVLDLARKLNEDRGFSPSAFLQRLSSEETGLVTAMAAEPEDAVWGIEFCLTHLRRARYEREQQKLQVEIDRLERAGQLESTELNALLVRRYELVQRIKALA